MNENITHMAVEAVEDLSDFQFHIILAYVNVERKLFSISISSALL